MMLQSNRNVSLFDKYTLVIPKGLKYHLDGMPGQRVLFITDKKESFNLSFEEGMPLMDLIPANSDGELMITFQAFEDKKYIHLKRSKNSRVAFFHIKIEDDDGKTLCLPGQMIVKENYSWNDGIEPIIVDIVKTIVIA